MILRSDGWWCGGNCCVLDSYLDVPQLLGVSAWCPWVRGGAVMGLSAGTFVLVGHWASFGGAPDSLRRYATDANDTRSRMGRGSAVAAIDRRLRGRSADRRGGFQIHDGAPQAEESACAVFSPQRIENRFGIARGWLGDSAEGGALSRHRVVEKFLWRLVGRKRRPGELSGTAIWQHRSLIPVSGRGARAPSDGLLRPGQRSKYRDSQLPSASHALGPPGNWTGPATFVAASHLPYLLLS